MLRTTLWVIASGIASKVDAFMTLASGSVLHVAATAKLEHLFSHFVALDLPSVLAILGRVAAWEAIVACGLRPGGACRVLVITRYHANLPERAVKAPRFTNRQAWTVPARARGDTLDEAKGMEKNPCLSPLRGHRFLRVATLPPFRGERPPMRGGFPGPANAAFARVGAIQTRVSFVPTRISFSQTRLGTASPRVNAA